MKPRLSLIITSFNRPKFLLRTIKFLVSYKLPIQLIILDSSKKKFENIEFSNLVDKFNIIVKKFSTDIFITKKIAKGCQFINTDYSVLCADDDFFFPASLLKCVDFLDANPDYSSAQGLFFNHTNYEETIKYGLNLYQLYRKAKSVIEEKSLDRIKKYLNGNQYAKIYAVQKTKDFKLIWENTDLYVDDWGLSELFPSCLSLILGKMKILPILYSSREPNTPHLPIYDRTKSHYERVERVKRAMSNEKISKALGGLVSFLNQYEGTSLSNTEKLFFNDLLLKIRNKSKKRTKYRYRVKVLIAILLSKLVRLIRFKSSNIKKYSSKFNFDINDFDRIKLAIISSQASKNEIEASRKLY